MAINCKQCGGAGWVFDEYPRNTAQQGIACPTCHRDERAAHYKALAQRAVIDMEQIDFSAFHEWDGLLEIGRCVNTGDGCIERIDDDDDAADWAGAPFWSVYAHQKQGGVQCVADFHTEDKAVAFAAGLAVLREALKPREEAVTELIAATTELYECHNTHRHTTHCDVWDETDETDSARVEAALTRLR